MIHLFQKMRVNFQFSWYFNGRIWYLISSQKYCCSIIKHSYLVYRHAFQQLGISKEAPSQYYIWMIAISIELVQFVEKKLCQNVFQFALFSCSCRDNKIFVRYKQKWWFNLTSIGFDHLTLIPQNYCSNQPENSNEHTQIHTLTLFEVGLKIIV